MRQEDKELLLKDLCARLPYRVKCYIPEINDYRVLGSIQYDGINTLFDFWNKEQTRYEFQLYISEFRPCLFPISNITEEQRNEISRQILNTYNKYSPYGEINPKGCDNLLMSCAFQANGIIEYFNKHNLDYRGLIPMGLANDATGLNIY